MNNNITKVVMPAWIFEQARDKEHLKKLVLDYMQRYPKEYVVKGIKNGFAICIKN